MALAGTGALQGWPDPAEKSATAQARADAKSRGGASQLASDEKLMLAHQQGAADASPELFARYRQPVYGFFRRRLDHAARAEELAQEVFLAVLREYEQLRYEEIAAVLVVPVGTVRSRLFRARMALKELLTEKAGTTDAHG
ncbi:MAG: sigma factor-like helix-turn-helix DNA-binding protein [Candidatus Acidiferrales bacterium]